jgi:hypothetical protein
MGSSITTGRHLSRLALFCIGLGIMLGLQRSWHSYAQPANDLFDLAWTAYESDATNDLAWGDYDSDGDLDLAVGNGSSFYGNASSTHNRLYRNDNGVLVLAWVAAEAGYTTSLAWGDYDNDGDLDLAVGNYVTGDSGYPIGGNTQPSKVYRNDNGTLVVAWEAPTTAPTQDVAWGDYDNDGDLDLAVGHGSTEYSRRIPDAIYRNEGGSFEKAWESPYNANTHSLAWGDYDNDGDLDLAMGTGTTFVLFRNHLSTFTQVGAPDIGDYYYSSGSLDWGDIDNDGDLDLVLGGPYQDLTVYRYENETYTMLWSLPNVRPSSIAWGDFSSDGVLDLALGFRNSSTNRVYRGNGNSYELAWESTLNDDTTSLAWADIDGDGSLDLAVGNRGANRFYHNRASELRIEAQIPANISGNRFAWGDYDSDGSLELLGGRTLFEHDANGFTLSGQLDDQQLVTTAFAWGDIDNDVDLDLAIGQYEGGLLLLRNENGGFVAGQTIAGLEILHAALGDMDNDGDADLAAKSATTLFIYRNEAGTFAPFWQIALDNNYYGKVAWGNYDGDNDLDIAVGGNRYSTTSLTRVYRNETNAFVAAWESLPGDGSGVAWGDYDNDGLDDLASGIYIYRSNGTTLSPTIALSDTILLPDYDSITTEVAWGDYDNDGDLDLGQALELINCSFFCFPEVSRYIIQRNDNGVLTRTFALDRSRGESLDWIDYDNDGDLELTDSRLLLLNTANTFSPTISLPAAYGSPVAWGDFDKDGDDDIASVGQSRRSQVYRNNEGMYEPIWSEPGGTAINGGAWGDYDGDGDLDLATNSQPPQVFTNENGVLGSSWSAPEPGQNLDSAWGDFDDDGDLDLAVANRLPTGYYYSSNSGSSRVYRNDNGLFVRAWESTETDVATSVAWGDYDSDGDLDLAVANLNRPKRVYRNEDGTFTLAWQSLENDASYSLDWGDYDGDGDLDLAVGNEGSASRVYRNTGSSFALAWSAPEGSAPLVAWGDYDNDGDLDLAAGNEGYYVTGSLRSRLYRNNNGSLLLSWIATENGFPTWGDYDNDGDLDLMFGQQLFQNGLASAANLINNPPIIAVQRPGTPAAGSLAAGTVFESQEISFTYTLKDPEGDPVRRIRAEYSLDGGGHWSAAIPAARVALQNLVASPQGSQHIFVWDTFASQVFGQSDNVVLRFVAEPALKLAPGNTPLFQRPYVATTTLPFRLRGGQIRVIDAQGRPVPGALVYKLPTGQSRGAQRFPERPVAVPGLVTNSRGILQGRGSLRLGDGLIALQPISATTTYSLYFTSAPVSESGLDLHQVSGPGMQTLTVRPEHPLVLFNLIISLEWDARSDPQFLARLQGDLRRTSELLFDWTDGQAALGRLTIYHDREQWDNAHIRVYATNRMRPNAVKGGIVAEGEERLDPDKPEIAYGPGQVRMGSVWNRYGEPSANLGEDWPRTLGHELAHFALFLDDNYIGLDDSGTLITVSSCPGAMSDPYRDDYGEFHPDTAWSERCNSTLSARVTGRSDWATIQRFYNQPGLAFRLNAPERFNGRPGPSLLPVAFSDITVVEPERNNETIAAPIVLTTDASGARLIPGSAARAILFQDQRLIDLGQPTLDQVLAHGAHTNDRLCVYDPDYERLGCTKLSATNLQLALTQQAGWRPELRLTPVTSTTLRLEVVGVPAGLQLAARLYPTSGDALEPVSLAPEETIYQALLPSPSRSPAFEGFIHLWVNEVDNGGRRETIVDFQIGGNPGRIWRRNAPRSNPGRIWRRNAPVLSADGQALLFGEGTDLEEGYFYALQASASAPPAPLWASPIGRSYRLTASAGVSLDKTSLSIGYLGSDVPAGGEGGIRLHRYDEVNGTWVALETRLDQERNEASAPVNGPGLYRLMTSLRIPVRGPGWNMIAYPLAGSAPVTTALSSIEGYYTTVYGYADEDSLDPWKVYDIDTPAWVNDLNQFDFGRGYWVNATDAVTVLLPPGGWPASATNAAAPRMLPAPPATYYAVLGPSGGNWQAGQPVMAFDGTTPCAQSTTSEVDGSIVLAIDVPQSAGCGGPGHLLTFSVGNQRTIYKAFWNNNRPHNLADPANVVKHIWLPIIMR